MWFGRSQCFLMHLLGAPPKGRGDEKLVQRLIQLFSSTEIFSKRRKVYACWRKTRVNCKREESDPCLTRCCKTCGTNNLTNTSVSMRKRHTFKKDCRSVVRKQTWNNSTFLACQRWGIFYRLYFRLLLESTSNFITRSLHCNFGNGQSTTTARRLNQSRICVALQWNLIAITFNTAEAQCPNWALVCKPCIRYVYKFEVQAWYC